MCAVQSFGPRHAPGWVALSNALLNRQVTAGALLDEDARRDPTQLSRRWVVLDRGDGGGVVGTAHLYFFPFDPPGCLHASVLVHPAHRGRGVGRALWRTLEAEARQHNGARLAATVADNDAASLAWARRRGFAPQFHRFTSKLDLHTFDAAAFQADVERAAAQGVDFADLHGADGPTLDRYVNFVADRLTETPDLAGHPRWPLEQVREILRLDHAPRPEWLVLAVGPDGQWLGTTAMVAVASGTVAYNELTAVAPGARGRGLALLLKLQAIRRAREAGFPVMRTNNHSANTPMLAVNRRLGFAPLPGQYTLVRPAPDSGRARVCPQTFRATPSGRQS
ncbi:GNAT family N-acetyltransferase [Deinococcus aerophilus]|uniref:GNAT family N-acetyltransferase n=1 Tax=Deinococcus aerophilus TaxID=522488 RepID=A0ABQ2H080_9DEIO|nr:GNAT family N-acetyltransferase [Deinococcus aerophilus]